MSLRDQFVPDLSNIFVNTDEFATTREFRIADGLNGFKVFNAPVVWDEEQAKEHPLVKIHGMYMGDVIMFIEHKYLPRMPYAGEMIYSPANKPWEILDCTDEESCYKIALSATRSHPGNPAGGRYVNN
jgi:hypothetical protein